MSTKEVMAKKERLTLSQLASYDDILTDALIDHVFFWTTIRKNRSKYNLTRGISEEDVTRILLHEVVVSKDAQHAEHHLLRLPGLRKFVDRLKTEREKEDFKRHMRKYINIWLPDCPFEVSTTNRYTIVTQEAAATARRIIKKSETIKYLCGNLVAMTPEEEQDLDLTRRDFSIVMSSRKKTPSLFLGPARFANHDCNANARLVTRGSEGMEIVALRNIEIEEEITVTYGDDYFGIGNCECLCRTCELEGRNGWAKQGPASSASGTATPSILERNGTDGPYSFRKKRKYQANDLTSDSIICEVLQSSSSKRRKSGSSDVIAIFDTRNDRNQSVQTAKRRVSTRTSTSMIQGLQGGCATADLSEDELAYDHLSVFAEDDFNCSRLCGRKGITESSLDCKSTILSVKSEKSSEALLCPTVELSTPPLVVDSALPTPKRIAQEGLPTSHTSSDVESIFDRDLHRSSSPASTPCRNAEGISFSEDTDAKAPSLTTEKDPLLQFQNAKQTTENAITKDHTTASDSESELSELSSTEDFDDINLAVIRRPKPKSTVKSKLKTTIKPRKLLAPPSPTLETPNIRRPGDHTRTALLLSEPFSRWVDCSTCSSCWVQANGYYTRKECPRCERHSKLYGYQWPKTEMVKGEEVGRVMDHRTVHRFIKPKEEARIKKKGKGLVGDPVARLVEQAETPAEESEPEEALSERRTSKRRRTHSGWGC
ncbi:Histone-lysine N-methyltransferase set9 [Lambiella insularis]|nr:Histone-lysine N-methyltransferase set9 [Lambiella insularis]